MMKPKNSPMSVSPNKPLPRSAAEAKDEEEKQ